jgi:hypothetical protein
MTETPCGAGSEVEDDPLKTRADDRPERSHDDDHNADTGGTAVVHHDDDDGRIKAAQGDEGAADGDDMDEYSVGAAPDEDDDISVGTAEGRPESLVVKDKYELVDCRFEKIGDVNGVFYYLGKRHAVSVCVLWCDILGVFFFCVRVSCCGVVCACVYECVCACNECVCMNMRVYACVRAMNACV